MTPKLNRPTSAIARLSGTVGAAKGIVGLPADERAFLDDLEAVLAYAARLERSLSDKDNPLKLAEPDGGDADPGVH